MIDAFSPIELGSVKLANRFAVAPMTRNRVAADGTATPQVAEYYRQRASAGLIVTEAIYPSTQARSFPGTPLLTNEEQAASWRQVTDAAHEAGAVIYAQLMHGGRVFSPDNDLVPLAPSAVRTPEQIYTPSGMRDMPVPRAMTEEDIQTTIDDFVHAARLAIAAGFDGVELHGANGFLIQQFFCSKANVRTDRWGGPAENRIRFAVAVVEAVAKEIGAERTALRVSPASPVMGIEEADTEALYRALFAALAPLGLAFVDMREWPGRRRLTEELRALWPGKLVLNPHAEDAPRPPHEEARDALDSGVADVVAFATAFLANPDLPRRIAQAGPYNEPDPATFYGGATGYTDYPFLEG
ncbi:N-ethylmaleimide reductase [Micromonospora rhizosphaerae]|uniref:N-ethylmaleimide reductase n=1 Tax=Micromonospora rhizosphaerae TaxID=568872 RepID=A0A1C6SX29_9ACTN|nr:alkene reductase [Micromonospora rhizosphaerae]SCL34050.1 N-ethylmaleimide reductase [Micromonospora rhizosphaerae]